MNFVAVLPLVSSHFVIKQKAPGLVISTKLWCRVQISGGWGRELLSASGLNKGAVKRKTNFDGRLHIKSEKNCARII